jgi:DNA-binding MarR family transcriptional regulator
MSKPVAGQHPVIDGDRYVPALLSHLNNSLSSTASQLYLRHFGIGINEWRILSVLSNTPYSNATHICDTVFMHKTVASRSLREMQAKALLTIEKRDGQRLMALTPKGQRMHDDIARIALEREQRLLAGLSASECELLLDCMRRMRAQLAELGAWDPLGDAGG